MYKVFSALLLVAAMNYASTDPEIEITPPEIQQEETITYYGDEHCKTPQLHPDEVVEIIKKTQTKDLNFVALAKAESGLYNHSNHNNLRGIFQVHQKFHKIDDYCSPEEQVKWLEWKLDQGASPKNLFPHTYKLLYTK